MMMTRTRRTPSIFHPEPVIPALPRQSRTRSILGLVGWLALCYAVAAIGGLWTARSVADWYPTLTKPLWTPPGWLFGPVWGVLYTTMGVSAWLIWRRAGVSIGRIPLALFALQLVLNLAWSGLFFGMRRVDLGLVDIIALDLAIMATIASFSRMSLPAAVLLVPYFGWVSFAAALNGMVWMLNR